MPGVELVIFDCDGVLVDSERLTVRTEVAILASLGWPLDEAEVVERFVGRSAAHMQAAIEEQLGRPIDWELEFEARYRDVFARELTPVDGVVGALDALRLPTCVASSGTHARIRHSLGLAGLLDRFDGRIFSVEDVARGKPAPDLFLWAAEQMGVPAAACAVVEDSPSGVEAALTAGMATFAYVTELVPPDRLRRDDVTLFDDMGLLPGLLGAAA